MNENEIVEMCHTFYGNVFHTIKSQVVGYLTVADYTDSDGSRCVRVAIVNRGFTFSYKQKDIDKYLVYGGNSDDFCKMIMTKYRTFVQNRFFKTEDKKKSNYISKNT